MKIIIPILIYLFLIGAVIAIKKISDHLKNKKDCHKIEMKKLLKEDKPQPLRDFAKETKNKLTNKRIKMPRIIKIILWAILIVFLWNAMDILFKFLETLV